MNTKNSFSSQVSKPNKSFQSMYINSGSNYVNKNKSTIEEVTKRLSSQNPQNQSRNAP